MKNVNFVRPQDLSLHWWVHPVRESLPLPDWLLRFWCRSRGWITIDGHDLSKVSLESYRSQLGVVLQDDFLFDGTIRENILFAKPDATEENYRLPLMALM